MSNVCDVFVTYKSRIYRSTHTNTRMSQQMTTLQQDVLISEQIKFINELIGSRKNLISRESFVSIFGYDIPILQVKSVEAIGLPPDIWYFFTYVLFYFFICVSHSFFQHYRIGLLCIVDVDKKRKLFKYVFVYFYFSFLYHTLLSFFNSCILQ